MEHLSMNNYQITEEMVRKELSQILEFREIKNSHVLSRFIEFVVEKKLSGQEDEIKEYTIAVKGLGKSADYNPQLDASVRIHAGRLRRILAQYYQEAGKDAAVFIDIPKGSYIPSFISRENGTANGMTFSPFNNEEQKQLSKDGVNGSFEPQKKPVLAILPFQNLSADNSKDYFVTGLGEQLSSDLARFHNISVISYFSTAGYKAALRDLQEMKREVNTDYVLTGGLRFMNDIVKLNIQLILADNGEIIFTDTYTGHLTPENIFDIQDEIVNQVLNIIADDNGIINMNLAHPTGFTKAENVSTQDAIYKYFDYTRDYSADKFQSAVSALENAVQIEPRNALASALLAGVYLDTYITAQTEDSAMLNKAAILAHTAVEIDPLCQHAQKSLAWVYLLSGKKDKSFEAIEQCIKLNPKASSIIATISLAYICQGDYVRGLKWLLESVHLNPTSPASAKFCFCLYYFYNNKFDESLTWLERISPLTTPFLKLLRLSLYGKMYQAKKKDIDESVLDLVPHTRNIIGRMVFDEKLTAEIMSGLQLAGLTVK